MVAMLGALAAPASVSAQSTAADPDQAYISADLELYMVAKQYFPADTSGVAARRIFRLTRDQLDASVASLLPGFAPQSIKETMPRDSLQTNYEYADILSFNAANTAALSGWIGDIAARVRKKPAAVINCAPDGGNAECLKLAARQFVIKAFRGDAGEDKINQIVAFYGAGVQASGFGQATGDLVEVVLNSPHFLFRKELDVTRGNRLAPAQLLQSVTYTLADVPPEAVNLSSERANQYLRTGPEASTTIGAIAASKPAQEKLVRFFTAWLEVKATSEFTISPQVFPEFNARLAAAMRSETMQFLRTQLSKPAPKLTDITQATQSFVPKSLEAIYRSKPDGSAGGKLVDLDPAQRLGIFSHPAVLASHSGPTDSRPIKRGVFWVRKVMCMEMEPPPKELHAKLYEMEGSTERQRIEQSTSGAACIGCHKVINPFAFFQESYDALGRFRTSDNGHPIDASILINFLDEEPAKTATAVEALKTLTGSMMFKQCFVRQLFRFYMGRQEEPADDPLLRRMFFEFAYQDKQDILRVVQMLAASDRIVKRK